MPHIVRHRRPRPTAAVAVFAALAMLVGLLAGLAGPAAAAPEKGDRPDFAESTLEIVTDDGARYDFRVEVAKSQRERAYGLMFVRELPADRGMLFDYGTEQRISMWMKNTYIPLDMLFIERDGTIESIVRRTVPLTRTAHTSKGRVRAVLELPGGTAERLGIAPGDCVVHPIFE